MEFQTEEIRPTVSEICALAHRQTHLGQMDKCSWRCTTTSLDNSIELQTKKELCNLSNGQARMGQMGNHGQVHMGQTRNDHDAVQLQF